MLTARRLAPRRATAGQRVQDLREGHRALIAAAFVRSLAPRCALTPRPRARAAEQAAKESAKVKIAAVNPCARLHVVGTWGSGAAAVEIATSMA